MFNFIKTLTLSTVLSVVAVGLYAAPADLTGQRQTSGLLQANNNQLHKNGLVGQILSLPYQMGWSITDNGGSWTYDYSVSNTPLFGLSLLQDDFFISTGGVTAADLSNVALDGSILLSQGTDYSDATVNGVSGIVFDIGGLLGILVSTGDFDLTFDVNSAPIWGDLNHDYTVSNRLGGLLSGYVDNAGFGVAPPMGSNLPGYIATPGQIAVPEPSTYLLLGSLVGFSVLMVRRRNMKQLKIAKETSD